jgi:glutamyl-tRNA reductase
MKDEPISKKYYLTEFQLIGISYETADVHTREKYSVAEERQDAFMDYLRSEGIRHGMIISTCNRTELYCFSEDPQRAIDLFVNGSRGNREEFDRVGFTKSGKDALEHLFRVCAGLESQIPGDFEIVGQVKKAFVKAKARHFSNGMLERMVNTAVFGSKRVKNETGFSTGASSVSYAAVRYIRDHFDAHVKVLLYGLGEIGRVTLENLSKHLPKDQITIINRNEERAADAASAYGIRHIPHPCLKAGISQHDILIVATGASAPIIFPEHFENPTTVLDLTVPSNVATATASLPHVTVVDVDALSKITLDTIQRRKGFIPHVEDIVRDTLADFMTWYHNRNLVPLVDQMRDELMLYFNELHQGLEICDQNLDLANRIINRLSGEIFGSGKTGAIAKCPVMMEAFKRRFQRELTSAK